jgi:hypothetical protein
MEVVTGALPVFGRFCGGMPYACWAPLLRVGLAPGVRQRFFEQSWRSLFVPPNLGLSLQYTHSPQSSWRKQFAHWRHPWFSRLRLTAPPAAAALAALAATHPHAVLAAAAAPE